MSIYPLPEPEASYLRRFFDGIDRALSAEMQAGQSLLEENLTFLLCRLLDGSSTFQRILEYSLDRLNVDLDACGTGQRLEIEFETNEHKKGYEATVSHADLGIVFKREAGPTNPAITKALLVQSKKLYLTKGIYMLASSYEAFDVQQYEALKAFADKHDWRSVYYFTYNPLLTAFAEQDQKILMAIEGSICNEAGQPWLVRGWHPEVEYLLHRFLRGGVVVPGLLAPSQNNPDAMRADRLASMQARPGVRCLSVRSVGHIAEAQKSVRRTFSLQDCYKYALSNEWWHSDATVPFLPLSGFFVDMLIGCTAGSNSEDVARVALGLAPTPSEDTPPPQQADTRGLTARYTLKITLRSLLGKSSNLFPQ